MKDKFPHIRITPETRKQLKIVAAHNGETIIAVVTRLAQEEWRRLSQDDGSWVSSHTGQPERSTSARP